VTYVTLLASDVTASVQSDLHLPEL